MGWRFNRRTKGSGGWLNFSKSGVSLTKRWSKNLTTNWSKRGRKTTLNFGKGFRYEWNTTKKEAPEKISWGQKLFATLFWIFVLYVILTYGT